MLARPDPYSCVECGLPFRSEGFCYHEGRVENGAAYWTDRGILCSPKCSLAHYRKRAADGTLPTEPASDPFDLQAISFNDGK